MSLSPTEYIQQLINKLGAYFIAKVLRNSELVKKELKKK